MPSCGSHKPSAPPPPVEDSGVAQGGHNCGAAASRGGTSASGTPVARVCGACGKAFSSEHFLRKHMDRRHPDLVRQDTAPPTEKEEAKDDSPASTPLPPPEEEARATEEQPSPPQQQEEAAGGKGTGSEDKGGGENGVGSEVVEGARRLGELVREREHARFKLEVVALRREVEDLKVRPLSSFRMATVLDRTGRFRRRNPSRKFKLAFAEETNNLTQGMHHAVKAVLNQYRA